MTSSKPRGSTTATSTTTATPLVPVPHARVLVKDTKQEALARNVLQTLLLPSSSHELSRGAWSVTIESKNREGVRWMGTRAVLLFSLRQLTPIADCQALLAWMHASTGSEAPDLPMPPMSAPTKMALFEWWVVHVGHLRCGWSIPTCITILDRTRLLLLPVQPPPLSHQGYPEGARSTRAANAVLVQWMTCENAKLPLSASDDADLVALARELEKKTEGGGRGAVLGLWIQESGVEIRELLERCDRELDAGSAVALGIRAFVESDSDPRRLRALVMSSDSVITRGAIESALQCLVQARLVRARLPRLPRWHIDSLPTLATDGTGARLDQYFIVADHVWLDLVMTEWGGNLTHTCLIAMQDMKTSERSLLDDAADWRLAETALGGAAVNSARLLSLTSVICDLQVVLASLTIGLPTLWSAWWSGLTRSTLMSATLGRVATVARRALQQRRVSLEAAWLRTSIVQSAAELCSASLPNDVATALGELHTQLDDLKGTHLLVPCHRVLAIAAWICETAVTTKTHDAAVKWLAVARQAIDCLAAAKIEAVSATAAASPTSSNRTWSGDALRLMATASSVQVGCDPDAWTKYFLQKASTNRLWTQRVGRLVWLSSLTRTSASPNPRTNEERKVVAIDCDPESWLLAIEYEPTWLRISADSGVRSQIEASMHDALARWSSVSGDELVKRISEVLGPAGPNASRYQQAASSDIKWMAEQARSVPHDPSVWKLCVTVAAAQAPPPEVEAQRDQKQQQQSQHPPPSQPQQLPQHPEIRRSPSPRRSRRRSSSPSWTSSSYQAPPVANGRSRSPHRGPAMIHVAFHKVWAYGSVKDNSMRVVDVYRVLQAAGIRVESAIIVDHKGRDQRILVTLMSGSTDQDVQDAVRCTTRTGLLEVARLRNAPEPDKALLDSLHWTLSNVRITASNARSPRAIRRHDPEDGTYLMSTPEFYKLVEWEASGRKRKQPAPSRAHRAPKRARHPAVDGQPKAPPPVAAAVPVGFTVLDEMFKDDVAPPPTMADEEVNLYNDV